MREQLGAMNDRDVLRLGRGEIGHLLFDRGRDNERSAIWPYPAAVLRHDLDAKVLELCAEACSLAAIECPVAAARMSSGHYLKLGKPAHPRAGKAGVMEATLAVGIGKLRRIGHGDEHEVAFAEPREKLGHIPIRKPHAAMGQGAANQVFLVSAVEIDVALERVAAGPAIHAVL